MFTVSDVVDKCGVPGLSLSEMGSATGALAASLVVKFTADHCQEPSFHVHNFDGLLSRTD